MQARKNKLVKNLWIRAILAVLVIAFVIGIVFYYFLPILKTWNWNSYYEPNYHVTIKYPPNWKASTTCGGLCFITPNGDSVLSIKFFYNPVSSRGSWQEESQRYGNTQTKLMRMQGRDVLSTTYTQEDPATYYVEDLTTPVFNGRAYVKLSIDNCPLAFKDECISVLYNMEKSIGLPAKMSAESQVYKDDQYGFSFVYPPMTQVKRYLDGEDGSKPVGYSRIGFSYGTDVGGGIGAYFYKKLPNESLSHWYNNLPEDAINGGPGPRQIIQEGTYYGYNGIKTRKYDAYVIYIEKNNLVVALSFDNADFSTADPDYQAFLNSFRFK